MVIQLTPALQSKVDQLVESGKFDDSESVLEASLSLLQQREAQLSWLRNELRIGEEEDLRGETVPYTSELMNQLLGNARERAHLGLPISDAVKPPD